MKLIIDIDDNVYELLNKTGITIDWDTAVHSKEKDRELTFAIFDLITALRNSKPYEERQKGEWQPLGITTPDIRCSKCGCIAFNYHKTPFCPGCGADMRGDGK